MPRPPVTRTSEVMAGTSLRPRERGSRDVLLLELADLLQAADVVELLESADLVPDRFGVASAVDLPEHLEHDLRRGMRGVRVEPDGLEALGFEFRQRQPRHPAAGGVVVVQRGTATERFDECL